MRISAPSVRLPETGMCTALSPARPAASATAENEG